MHGQYYCMGLSGFLNLVSSSRVNRLFMWFSLLFETVDEILQCAWPFNEAIERLFPLALFVFLLYTVQGVSDFSCKQKQRTHSCGGVLSALQRYRLTVWVCAVLFTGVLACILLSVTCFFPYIWTSTLINSNKNEEKKEHRHKKNQE